MNRVHNSNANRYEMPEIRAKITGDEKTYQEIRRRASRLICSRISGIAVD